MRHQGSPVMSVELAVLAELSSLAVRRETTAYSDLPRELLLMRCLETRQSTLLSVHFASAAALGNTGDAKDV